MRWRWRWRWAAWLLCVSACASGSDAPPAPRPPCGGFAFGASWPDGALARREVNELAPASALSDCGPSCRQVTTRLNFVAGQPYELSFSGARFVSRAERRDPGEVGYAELDSGAERTIGFRARQGRGQGFGQVLMGDETVVKQQVFIADGRRWSGLCQVHLGRQAERLLLEAEGEPNDAAVDLTPVAADARHVVVSQGRALRVVDGFDGSVLELSATDAGVTSVSLAGGAAVVAVAGRVLRLDLATGERRFLTPPDVRAEMAVADAAHVVWIEAGEAGDSVMVLDAAGGEPRRIASGPSRKLYPTVEGDLVAWIDTRDATPSLGAADTPRDRLDVYAYDLAKEVEGRMTSATLGARLRPTLPRLHRGRLYVVGRAAGRAQLFELNGLEAGFTPGAALTAPGPSGVGGR